jgi:hypothetical protein
MRFVPLKSVAAAAHVALLCTLAKYGVHRMHKAA